MDYKDKKKDDLIIIIKKTQEIKKLLNQHNFKFKKNKIDNNDKKDKSEKNIIKVKIALKNS